jgi:xanthine dehydrogenase accessory factor
MSVARDILDLVGAVKTQGEAVAVATVARASPSAPARPGERMVIASDGALSGAWLTGPERDAVLRAAREVLGDGRGRLVPLRLKARRAKMDILVEPLLPRPVLVLCGASPVARALSDLARRVGFFVTVCAPPEDHPGFPEADRLVDGCAPPRDLSGEFFLVISGRETANRAALRELTRLPARYLAIVDTPAALRRARAKTGAANATGLDIGAITPEEIALSILAEMVAVRRRGQRCS